MAEEPAVEDRFYATFEKHDKFVAAQTRFLELCRKPLTSEEDDEVEQLLTKLSLILDEYQEQAYLLDPFLERLLGPVVEQFKLSVTHVSSSATHQSSTNISRVAFYLYRYVKFRGHKTITRFFPHEVDDLSIALTFLLTLEDSTEIKEYHRWPLRYVMLLWLSLICMLPFDLAQFDEPEDLGKTASDIESVAKQYLSKAGVERGGAAVLLSRLYTRPDTSTKFPDFLRWTVDGLQSSHQFFSTIGALEVVCELLKSGSISHVSPHMGLLSDLAIAVNGNKALMNNTLVRKYRIKLISRIVLRLLPPRRTSKGRKGKALVSTSEQLVEDEDDEDGDLPDELEDTLGDLFTALQDKDTVVRYSAAKAIARISERLPAEFTEQVLQQVLQLFAIHSVGAATLYDMPSIAESTWHGASLACAEMARRGLVADSRLGEVVDWMRQALFFDIRKGAHSVGSSVRDAASYVLWSLARAQDAAALARFADDLARTLVTVAVFDREVHIRRAASAAFQEFVGRTSLFPHGIDVLRKTDFYAVGTRRNAFLAAAPEVAEHDVYRDALLRHLLTVTLRHWDPAMRRLGAQAVRAICELDLWVLGPRCAAQAALLVDSADTGDLHGALWTLAELAAAFKAAGPEGPARPHLRQIFGHLAALSPAAVQSVRHEIVTAAACHLIANSIAREDVDAPGAQWRVIIDFSLKSASAVVQDAVADALAALSTLADCSAYVDRTFLRDTRTAAPAAQQNACRVLGVLDYRAHPHGLLPAVSFLLACVDKATALQNVEARRNAYAALPQILANVVERRACAAPSEPAADLPPATVAAMFDALIAGLDDYTTDERGDVGSWVRIACVRGLAAAAALLLAHAPLPYLAQALPPARFHAAVAGILKQGVERLDNVRHAAGEQLAALVRRSPPDERWAVCGRARMRELFLRAGDEVDWNDGARLFPRAVQLLAVPEYRAALLAGLVLSASSRTDSTQRPVSQSLVAYAQTLPVAGAAGAYSLRGLAADLLAQARGRAAANAVVVPVLQTFGLLLEADALAPLFDDAEGLQSLQHLLALCTRGVDRFKSVQRIGASLRIVVQLLCAPRLRAACAAHLPAFLAHAYPRVRADAAECLYVVLQSRELGAPDAAEDALLETEWSASDVGAAAETVARLLAGEGA